MYIEVRLESARQMNLVDILTGLEYLGEISARRWINSHSVVSIIELYRWIGQTTNLRFRDK